MHILYVDDEPDLLDLAKIFLERSEEFTVDTATSGPSAIEMLSSNSYDAVISDYEMPSMNGIQLLQNVRSAGNQIPFIIFTGRGREEVVILALNCGADYYIQKGGDPTAMFAELEHIVQNAVLMRRTLRTLAEQEQRYHDIQNSNDLIQSVAPDGRFLFVNKKWIDTLGYSEQELASLTVFDIIHEESRAHCMEIFPRIMAGENVGIIEASFRAKDGTKIYVEGLVTCQIADGKPQYTRGIFKDVTDRKNAEAALIESEARYRNVVEDQTELIARCLPDGTHIFVNNAYCRYFSVTHEDVIGKRTLQGISKEDLPEVQQHFASLTRESPVARIINRITLPGGEIRWLEWTNRAIFDSRGMVREYQSVGRDITDLKTAEQELLRKNDEIRAAYEQLAAAEEELRGQYDDLVSSERRIRESEEKYRELFNSATDEVYTHEMMVDGKFKPFLEVNDLMCAKLGYTREELLRMSVPDIVSDTHKKKMAEIQQKFSETGISIFYGEHKRKDGSVFPVEITIRRMTREGKEIVLAAARDITDRKLVEDTLRERDIMFRVIFDNSPYPIALNRIPDGKFLAVNAAFLRSSGFSESEVLGRSPVELGLLSLLEFGKLSSHLLLKGKIDNLPMVLKSKDGRVVHVLFSTIPVTISDQSAILTVTVEVTQLRRIEEELLKKNQEMNAAYEDLNAKDEELRANFEELAKKEQELRASEERFRAMFHANPTMLFTLDLDARIVSVNQFGAESLGYTPEELEGKPVLDVFYPADHKDVADQFRICTRSPGKVFSWQFRKIKKDGTVIWVSERARAVPGPDGVLRVFVVCQDVTEQKRAYDELRLLKITVDAAYDEVLWLDFSGRVLYANEAACRISGYSHEEFEKMSIFDLDPAATPDKFKRFAEELRESKSLITTTHHRRKDGTLIDVEIMSVYVNRDNQEYSFSFIRDITERKQTEHIMHLTNRKLSLLNSITRHDILNNITLLSGYLTLMRDLVKDPKVTKYLEKMDSAKKLITKQIEFTRIYQDLGTTDPIWHNIGSVVDQLPVPQNISLRNDCRNVAVYADPILQKVFFSLMDNTVRHGQHAAMIRVSAAETPSGLLIVWEDDGAGIPDSEKEKIFLQGYGKNTGLGLFLSREILSITGMTMTEKGTFGKGVRFEILVPRGVYRITPS